MNARPTLVSAAGSELPDATTFVRTHTRLAEVPGVPEVRLHQATDAIELWEDTETLLRRTGTAPPFWAFSWPGGQALARFVLDDPALVAGRSVLDLGSGSGLVALAAARAGARTVLACDVDPLAIAAVTLNAVANAVTISCLLGDILVDPSAQDEAESAEVVLAGDVCYEKGMAARMLPYLERVRDRGAVVLLGDPGRVHLPRHRLREVATYELPVGAALEGPDVRSTTVWRLV